MHYIFIFIGMILVLATLFVVISILRLRELEKNQEVCAMNIEESLKEKYTLLSNLVQLLKEERFVKQFEIISDKDLFEKEKSLFNLRWDINKYMKEQKIEKTEEIKDLLKQLAMLEENIEGLKDYYNMQSMLYNEKIDQPIFSIIYRIFKLKKKDIFQLRKLEEYEILKN